MPRKRKRQRKCTLGGDIAVARHLLSLLGVLGRRRSLSLVGSATTTAKEHVADSMSDDRTGHGSTHGRGRLGEHPRWPSASLLLRLSGESLVLLLLWVGGGVCASRLSS